MLFKVKKILLNHFFEVNSLYFWAKGLWGLFIVLKERAKLSPSDVGGGGGDRGGISFSSCLVWVEKVEGWKTLLFGEKKKWENKNCIVVCINLLSHVVATPEIFSRAVIKKLKLHQIYILKKKTSYIAQKKTRKYIKSYNFLLRIFVFWNCSVSFLDPSKPQLN